MTQAHQLRNKTLYGNPAIQFVKEYYHIETSELHQRYNLDQSEHHYQELDEVQNWVSVIIPTYNRKAMLSKTIESVRKQSYKYVEIIIINDCSNDGTKEYLDELSLNQEHIVVLHNATNLNAGVSRNLGYHVSKGTYVVFLDDDDYYIDEHFFSKAVTLHQTFHNLSFVSGNALIEEIEKKSLSIRNLNHSGIIDRKLYLQGFQTTFNKPLSTFTTMFKKSALDSVDFKNMKMMNDASIYLRALCTHDAYMMNDIIGVYVKHLSNISQSLNTEFILLNLAEKLWVYHTIIDEGFIKKSWMSKQTILTMRYFIKGSQPDIKSMSVVIKWILKNFKSYRFVTSLEIIILYIKRKY